MELGSGGGARGLSPGGRGGDTGCRPSGRTVVALVVLGVVVIVTATTLLAVYLDPGRGHTTKSGENLRLPSSLVPIHYTLALRPHIYSSDPATFHFNGTVKVLLTAVEATSHITLHAKMLSIGDDIPVRDDANGDVIDVKGTSYDDVTEFYVIELAQALTAGRNYSVALEFRGNITGDLIGVYFSSYVENRVIRYLATSQLQPTDARKVFPCFDEPALKATVSVTMEVAAPYRSFSNTVITSTTTLPHGWTADHYERTKPMSTYILAFTVADFDCLSRRSPSGKKVEICARKEAVRDGHADYAGLIAGPMQDYLETYHRIDYPMPRTVHIAVPDFSSGAMENWGHISYRETALLFDPTSGSAAQKQRVASVVAHELAHMWFGNLVTPAWWDDIWLNEGFASYMQTTTVDDYYADTWDMDGQFVVNGLQRVLQMDALATSHPIYQPVNDPAEINEIFDLITYNKGASVIRMMNHFVTESVFRTGISTYLVDRAYKAAHHNELFGFLTEAAANHGKMVDVAEVMSTWILQMGYPVVHLDYDPSTGRMTLTQKHFLIDPTQSPTMDSPFGYKWIIPISLISSRGLTNQTWLRDTSETVQIPSGASWVLGNAMQRYYYRVNYNRDMWSAIIGQLQDNHTVIHSNSRAQLIDDSANLGRSGDLEQVKFLELSCYLVKERHYIPWRSFQANIQYFDRMLMQSVSYEHIKEYVQKIVQPLYDWIGWVEDMEHDSHLKQQLRVTALTMACYYGIQDCLDRSSQLYDQWMASHYKHNRTNPISLNLRSVVYCSAIQNGGEAEWRFAWNRLQAGGTSAEKKTLLIALTCTRQASLLTDYLDRAIRQDGIRRQDFATVISCVAANPAGRSLAWNVLKDNWSLLLEWFGSVSFTLPRIVDDVTVSFSTESELEELRGMLGWQLATSDRAVKQSVETAQANLRWRSSNEKHMVAWLQSLIIQN